MKKSILLSTIPVFSMIVLAGCGTANKLAESLTPKPNTVSFQPNPREIGGSQSSVSNSIVEPEGVYHDALYFKAWTMGNDGDTTGSPQLWVYKNGKMTIDQDPNDPLTKYGDGTVVATPDYLFVYDSTDGGHTYQEFEYKNGQWSLMSLPKGFEAGNLPANQIVEYDGSAYFSDMNSVWKYTNGQWNLVSQGKDIESFFVWNNHLYGDYVLNNESEGQVVELLNGKWEPASPATTLFVRTQFATTKSNIYAMGTNGVYELKNNEWQLVGPNPPFLQADYNIVGFNNKIYAVADADKNGELVGQGGLYEYDSSSNTWITAPGSQTLGQSQLDSAVVYHNDLYVGDFATDSSHYTLGLWAY